MKYTNEELLDEIRRLADGDVPPTKQEMNDVGVVSQSVYYDRFGSWNESVKAAGFKPNHPSDYSKEYMRDEMKENLDRVIESAGEVPSKKAFDEESDISSSTYRDRFGSWQDALNEFGYELAERGYSEEELLPEIVRLKDSLDLDRAPLATEMEEFGRYSYSAYNRHFESWEAAVQASPLNEEYRTVQRGGPADEELVDELRRLGRELGRPPTTREMNELGEYHKETYRRRFGSWCSVIEDVFEEGITPDRVVKTDIRTFYGGSWEDIRASILERDDFECQRDECGISEQEHRQRTGNGLEVHHITPVKEFDDMETAHHPNNLITFCKRCHNKVEAGKYGVPHFQRNIEWW